MKAKIYSAPRKIKNSKVVKGKISKGINPNKRVKRSSELPTEERERRINLYAACIEAGLPVDTPHFLGRGVDDGKKIPIMNPVELTAVLRNGSMRT